MASEEEVELRDLVAHTLETRGVLGKIRAQLRASIFLALEEQEAQDKPHPLVSSKFRQYLKTKEGQIATALVREFLSYFELDYTCSVFDPETNALEVCPGRDKLAGDLGLDSSSSDGPLISQLLQRPATSAAPAAITAAPSLTTDATPTALSRTTLDPLSGPLVNIPQDGDRQPFSLANHESGTSGSSSAPHAHRDFSNSVLKSEEDGLVKPEDSLHKSSADDLKGGGGGIGNSIHEGGEGGGRNLSQLSDENVARTEEVNLGNGSGGGGSNASLSEGWARGGNGTQASGGSGPPKSRSISMSLRSPAHNGTNGLLGNGTDSGQLQSTSTRSTKSEGQHRAGVNDEIEEDIPISEHLSNNEENTDDFFGSKSSSKAGSNKGDFSYEDDFHSDISKSESNPKLQVGAQNKCDETEDYSFSESNFGGDLDYVEPAKT